MLWYLDGLFLMLWYVCIALRSERKACMHLRTRFSLALCIIHVQRISHCIMYHPPTIKQKQKIQCGKKKRKDEWDRTYWVWFARYTMFNACTRTPDPNAQKARWFSWACIFGPCFLWYCSLLYFGYACVFWRDVGMEVSMVTSVRDSFPGFLFSLLQWVFRTGRRSKAVWEVKRMVDCSCIVPCARGWCRLHPFLRDCGSMSLIVV